MEGRRQRLSESEDLQPSLAALGGGANGPFPGLLPAGQAVAECSRDIARSAAEIKRQIGGGKLFLDGVRPRDGESLQAIGVHGEDAIGRGAVQGFAGKGIGRRAAGDE